MKVLSNSENLNPFIAPKMTDIITFLDNNGKLAIFAEVNIHGFYCCLEVIVSPITFATSVHHSFHSDPSYFTNNDTATLQPVIADLSVRQKAICECCGRIGKNSDVCIIPGPNFLPPDLIIKMN